ncbi:MAG TPA: hypothetical protein VK203_27565 [Nostocaceae cyanobacterium]|nr:hypothetical protein [Nostocaceae cyanobacterium]
MTNNQELEPTVLPTIKSDFQGIADILKVVASNPGCTTWYIAQQLPKYHANFISACIVRMQAAGMIYCCYDERNHWHIAQWLKA